MKGSIQLSANVMVILVLTIVIISVGFVIFGKVFAKAERLSDEIDSQSQRQLQVLLKDSNVALSKNSINVEPGKATPVWIGIDNTDEIPYEYTISYSLSGVADSSVGTINLDDYIKILPTINIGAQKTGYVLLLVEPPNGAPKTQISIDVTVSWAGESVTRKLFVKIN